MQTSNVSIVKDIVNSTGSIITASCSFLCLVSIVYLVYRISCLHFRTSTSIDAKETKEKEILKLNCSIYTLSVLMSFLVIGIGLAIFCTIENTALSVFLICVGILFLLILLSISNLNTSDDDEKGYDGSIESSPALLRQLNLLQTEIQDRKRLLEREEERSLQEAILRSTQEINQNEEEEDPEEESMIMRQHPSMSVQAET